MALDENDIVTTTAVQVFENKSFLGSVSFFTQGARIGVTAADEPLAAPTSLFHIVNPDVITCSFRVTSYW